MNKKQAEDKGYRFTGYFGWNKEELKSKAKEIRGRGFKAVVVTAPVPKNPLSRSIYGYGYSVYVEETYIIFNTLERLKKRYEHFPERFKEMKQRHEKEARELREEHIRIFTDIQMKSQILKDQGFYK